MKKSMIIGVTGKFASGKDAVGEILQEMKFYHISLSDMLREELQKRKKKLTRDNLIAVGNELRTTHGADVLARLALEKVREGENYVITSFRNPQEVNVFNNRKDFALVFVEAPENVRLKRIIDRNRENDPKTLQELREKETIENSNDPNGQQLNNVAKMAKIIMTNDSGIEELKDKTKRLVKDWLYKLQNTRPDWDTYFMNIAEQVKTRASCLSASKGAILVKDKRIISTGYNGTPKNTQHCNQGGCQRCTKRHLGELKSGQYDDTCVCSHAEENSIVQAAYHGISTKDCILYATYTPCTNCAKMIINAGIKEVITKIDYPDDIGRKLLKKAGVVLRRL